MAKIFYDHLVAWDTLVKALDELELSSEERWEVVAHFEQIIHTEILMVIIDKLPAHKHDEFLDRFHAAPYDEEHFIYLKAHLGEGVDIETLIQKKSQDLLTQLITDVLS
jgi:hypothetical protein